MQQRAALGQTEHLDNIGELQIRKHALEALILVEEVQRHAAQLADIKGLFDIMRNPHAVCEALDAPGAKCRHDHHPRFGGDFFGAQNKLETVDLSGHFDIRNEQVDIAALQNFHARFARSEEHTSELQ